MPQNKRESIIFTVMMCFVMVFWMSMYNVAMNMGGPVARKHPGRLARFPDCVRLRDVL